MHIESPTNDITAKDDIRIQSQQAYEVEMMTDSLSGKFVWNQTIVNVMMTLYPFGSIYSS